MSRSYDEGAGSTRVPERRCCRRARPDLGRALAHADLQSEPGGRRRGRALRPRRRVRARPARLRRHRARGPRPGRRARAHGARSRRVHAEAGGEFVDTLHTEVRGYCKKFDLPLVSLERRVGSLEALVWREGERTPGPEFRTPTVTRQLNDWYDGILDAAQKIVASDPGRAGAARLDRETAEVTINRAKLGPRARFLAERRIRADYGVDADQLSLLFFLLSERIEYDQPESGIEAFRIGAGSDALATAFASRLALGPRAGDPGALDPARRLRRQRRDRRADLRGGRLRRRDAAACGARDRHRPGSRRPARRGDPATRPDPGSQDAAQLRAAVLGGAWRERGPRLRSADRLDLGRQLRPGLEGRDPDHLHAGPRGREARAADRGEPDRDRRAGRRQGLARRRRPADERALVPVAGRAATRAAPGRPTSPAR